MRRSRVQAPALRLAVLALLTTVTAIAPGSAVAQDPGTISIADASLNEGDAGTSTLSFAVTLSAVSDQPVTVEYATAAGSAQAGTDFESGSGTVTFVPGDTSEQVSVTILGDVLDEADETLSVDLSDAVGAAVDDGSATGTITDDDPQPSLAIGDASVVEGGPGSSNPTMTVSLSAASGRTVTVDHATVAGTAVSPDDFSDGSGTLTFAPGETSKAVVVELLGDSTDESDEALTVELSGAVNAALADASGTFTVDDDDGPAISIADAAVSEGTGAASTLTLTVTLSAPSPQQVTVRFATADGTATAPADYVAASGTVTFAPGETSKALTVTVEADAHAEPGETIVVGLSSAVDGSIGDGSATATITDDDAPAPAPPGTAAPAPPGTAAPAPASPKPAPARDRTAPRMTRVTLTPSVARTGATLRIAFRLDDAARVAGEVTRRTRGVRTRGGRCVVRTPKRRGAGCGLRVRVGTLATRAGAGDNRGRLDLTGLRAGDYTLRLTPTDAAGNVGAARLVAFRIRR